MNASLKESLINTGSIALLSLNQQIGHLLDVVDFYIDRYQPTSGLDDDGQAFKREQLMTMVETLGAIPCQLADVLIRWKTGEPRILSRLGVEITLINELWMTIEVTSAFFMQEGIDIHPFNHNKAKNAYIEISRCNRCMP